MQAIDSLKRSLDLMRNQIIKIQMKRNTLEFPSDELDSKEIELKQNWTNIATTTVIAYYNAAVESEFTC